MNKENTENDKKPYLATAGQEMSELAKTAMLAVLLALVIRTFLFSGHSLLKCIFLINPATLL